VAGRESLVQRLAGVVGPAQVLAGEEGLAEYSHDATFMDAAPALAVLPADTDEVAAVIKICAETATPLTARGSGTGLSGGPVPLGGGVVLSLQRLRHLEIDAANICAVAGAGVITSDIQDAAAGAGLMYPPDPASHTMSTIGGNVACNSGGMSCLKYGVTADYVLGGTVVLADGRVLQLGGRTRKRASGYRLMSLFVGSEGTLGIVTQVILKLIPLPRHRATAMVGYRTMDDAAVAVSRVLGSGHLPAALELMDRAALDLLAHLLPPGFKTELGAIVIVEQDGNDAERVRLDLEGIVGQLGGLDNRVAQTEAERDGLWLARRSFGKRLMEIRKNFFAEDISVPIAAVPEAVRRFEKLSRETGVSIATVGHAGDGNLHPAIIFTDEQRHLVGPMAARIFKDAVELGGSISAEHGLGALKRDYAELEHGPDAIGLMRQIKAIFDPIGILNPHKVLPEGPADDAFLERMPGWGTKLASGRNRSEVGA
jgi:glycolate oxidase